MTGLWVLPTQRQDDWWQQRHQQKLAERQSMSNDVDLLFMGDSITQAWEEVGQSVWQQYFGNTKALNLGFNGDCTEHLLWRIQNGQIDHLTPKLVVLMIGTNNAGHRLDSPQEITAGVKAILTELAHRLPSSHIVLMAILPRSRNTNKPMRQRVDATNQQLQKLTTGLQVSWLNINRHLLTPQGLLLESVMPDLLHPNTAQYALWAEHLAPIISQHFAAQAH
jgi:beta-glucosidase